MKHLSILTTAALAASMFTPTAAAQDLSPTLIASSMSNPLYAISPPGDTDRLFILEQNSGRIRIIDLNTNTIQSPDFLNVSSIISSGGERGLLGLAFTPDYDTSGVFYVSYTASGSGASRVSRYNVSANPDVADASSGDVVLSYSQPFSNHNGGCIQFGPDGFLYVGTGDGGSGGDPGDRASNPNQLLGKMLRLDMSGDDYPFDSLNDYANPADNPFNGIPGRPEIWFTGLRNPWRFSFDRETGGMWIADVGQNAWEEVNYVPNGDYGGRNFGWKCREGPTSFGASSFCNASTNFVDPVQSYNHNTGGCSISGGFVARGGQPSIRGKYFYSDICSNRIFAATLTSDTAASNQDFTTNINIPGGESIPSFGEDGAGNVYICDFNGGQIWRIDTTEIGTAYCFGDGSGAACPCGNEVLTGSAAGCRNETGTGASLAAVEQPTISPDGLEFEMNGASPNTFGLLFSADNQLGGGNGIVFSDGLRCMGGNLVRHGTRPTNSVGNTTNTWGPGLAAQGAFVAGQTRNFQVFYRTSDLDVCMNGVNTTNGVSITFQP